MKKLKKPVKKRSEPYWDYLEIIAYIEKKYKIETRGYIPKNGFSKEQLKKSGKNKKPYLDFWHWQLEHDANSISNGSFFYLSISEYLEEDDEEYCPFWVKEIIQIIYNEFKEEDMYCRVAW